MPSEIRQPRKISGFSVLEISAVLVIGSILIGGYAALMNARMESYRQETTRSRLADIDTALKSYLQRENRYPTPAHIATPLDDEDFGREQPCSATSGIEVNGRAGAKVCIGSLPIRDLFLPDEYVSDAWSGKFLYAVTQSMTDSATFDIADGAIDVLDGATGLSVLETPGIAHYFVLSHGANQKGAYTLSGTGVSTAAACGPDPSEMQNCGNDNAVFSVSLYTISSTTASSMDDMSIYWPSTVSGGKNTPSYMVMAFDQSTCPQGWTPNIWTDNTDVHTGPTRPSSKHTINGRLVVGTGAYNEPFVSGQDPFSKNYTLRETGGQFVLKILDENLPQHTHSTGTIGSLVPFKVGSTTISNVLDNNGTPSSTYFTAGAQTTVHNPYHTTENEMPIMAFHYCMKL